MANFISKAWKKTKNWVGEKITEPIKKAVDTNIGQPLTQVAKETKRAVGLEQTPIPDAAKTQLDPAKLQGLADYGQRVRQTADTTKDPGALQIRKFTPTQTQNAPMPTSQMKNTQVQYQAPTRKTPTYGNQANTLAAYSQRTTIPTEGNNIPQQQMVSGVPAPSYQKIGNAPTLQKQSTTTLPQARDEAGIASPTMKTEGGTTPSYHEFSTQQAPTMNKAQGMAPLQREGGFTAPARTTEGSVAAPTMAQESSQTAPKVNSPAGNLTLTREGGNVLSLGRQNDNLNLGRESKIGLNNQDYTGAVKSAMASQATPLSLAQGFDPAMREKAVSLATSGMSRQKENALAMLKEEQMKAGNYGSSVAQKQMADLVAQYDEKIANATNSVDVQDLQANREDRYRNLTAEQQRASQLGSLAGVGQGMELAGSQFGRQGISADNNAAVQEAQFRNQNTQANHQATSQEFQSGVQGRAADRASQMQEAQFGREGTNQDNALAMQQAEFARTGRTMDNATALQLAQYGREGRGIDTNAAYQQAEFERTGRATDRGSQVQEYQTEEQARAANNALAQQQAEFARQGMQLDNANITQGAEFQRQGRSMDNATAMQLAQYDRSGRETDYNRGVQGAQFGREGTAADNATAMTEAQFNQGATAQNNQIEQLKADYARQGIQLDNNTAMQLATYGREGRGLDYGRAENQNQQQFQNRMETERFGREGQQMDFQNQGVNEQNDWNRTMEANQFNRTGDTQRTQDDWMRFQEQQRQNENQAESANNADRFNIGNEANQNQENYGRFRNATNDLSNYTSGNLNTPESQKRADEWAQQEADRTARLGAVTNTALAGAQMYAGMPSSRTAAPASPTTPLAPATTPNVQLQGTGPTSKRFMLNQVADQPPAERLAGYRRNRR